MRITPSHQTGVGAQGTGLGRIVRGGRGVTFETDQETGEIIAYSLETGAKLKPRVIMPETKKNQGNVTEFIGYFFEKYMSIMLQGEMITGNLRLKKQVAKILDMDKMEQRSMPDIVLDKNGNPCYIEVKASHYSGGGVVKGSQLEVHRNKIPNCYYALVYHSCKGPREKFKEIGPLIREELQTKSIYIFPLEIIEDFYKNDDRVKAYPLPKCHNGSFKTMVESTAKRIFEEYKGNAPMQKTNNIYSIGFLF